MGNGLKKASEIISPPSSPIPKKSKKDDTPKDDSPSPKKRRRKGTPSPGKKKSPKTKGGKMATPEKPTDIKATPEKFATPEQQTEIFATPAQQTEKKPRSKTSSSKKRKRGKRTNNPTVAIPVSETPAIVVENEEVSKDEKAKKTKKPALKKKAPKNDYPRTMEARVHRLRHMGYVPGSISAFTAASTEDGQIVVARNDGSYELKAITSSVTRHHYSDSLTAPNHRLITIAETVPMTGRKSASENSDNDSEMEEDIDSGLPEPFPDAASSLCWIYPSSTPVCVGSGPNGNLWIIDFKNGGPSNAVSSGGGGIFDLATCKFHGAADASGVKSLPFVAGACEDGSVRIWRVTTGSAGQGEIQDPPLVTLPTAGAPVLSLAWKNVTVLKQGRTSTYQTVMFAAVADGTIRKYGLDIEEQSSSFDYLNGRNENGKTTDSSNNHYTIPRLPKSILRMTIENKGRKDPTKVWTLLLLQDNTLVAGTSLGQVQFWNGETGTLTEKIIQSNAQADVLKIVVNSDETKLFCSGVDSRVVCLERKKAPIAAVSTPAPESELTALVTSHLTTFRPWKMTISQRPHTHDVKAMAIVSSSSKTLSTSIETLLTGGVDTKICSYSVSLFGRRHPQIWYPWPSATSLFSSTTCVKKGLPKLMSMRRHDRIELYQLETLKEKKKPYQTKCHKREIAQHPTSIPVGTIQLGGSDSDDNEDEMVSSFSSPLQASALSPNGKFLAVSNTSSTYLFNLKFVADNVGRKDSMQLKPEKIELPEGLKNISATTFSFVDDELYIGDSSGHQKVHILSLPSDKNKEKDENDMYMNEDDAEFSLQTVSLPEPQKSSIAEEIILPICSIHADGEYMVTSSHARENSVQVFRRRSRKDSYEHFWTLPSLGGGADARPAAIALVDSKRLVIATYRSHLYLLDIETRSLNQWSEQYGFPIRERKWTEDPLCGRGYPLRLIPQENGRVVMTSFGTFCVIDLNKPMPRRCRTVPEKPVLKIKRKFKPTFHINDGDDEDGDDNDDHWLEPRATKVVEDEYSHIDPDVADDDANETHVIPIPEETRDEELISRNCTICTHYKNMLYTSFLGPKEMIVVQQPWSEIVETFPAALQRRIYGAD